MDAKLAKKKFELIVAIGKVVGLLDDRKFLDMMTSEMAMEGTLQRFVTDAKYYLKFRANVELDSPSGKILKDEIEAIGREHSSHVVLHDPTQALDEEARTGWFEMERILNEDLMVDPIPDWAKAVYLKAFWSEVAKLYDGE